MQAVVLLSAKKTNTGEYSRARWVLNNKNAKNRDTLNKEINKQTTQ